MTTKQTDLALGVGVRTEQGRREDNQDKMTAFSTPMGMLYVVADGMGGHRGGAEASRRVIEGYQKHLNAIHATADPADILQHATLLTNAEIFAESTSGDPSVSGMGSTVVMALLKSSTAGMEMMTAHIGDSRGYLQRSGALRHLTRDHSAVQRMVDEQLITPEMARTHPDLNILTRAIGKQPEVAIEVSERMELYPGDTILLCTDGLWGPLTDDQISRELGIVRTAQETAEALVQLALDEGSDDNITLQVLRLESRSGAPQAHPSLGASVGDSAPLIHNRSTEPGPAFTQTLSSASLPAPAPAHSAFKKRPLFSYLVAAGLCLCLAGAAWFSIKHFRAQSPVKQKDRAVHTQFTCAAKEEMTQSGTCKPVSAAESAAQAARKDGKAAGSAQGSERKGASAGKGELAKNKAQTPSRGARARSAQSRIDAPPPEPAKPPAGDSAPRPKSETVNPSATSPI